MMKLSLEHLEALLASAKVEFPVGNTYRHNASGNIYEITGHAVQEATQKVQIMYRTAHLPGKAPHWTEAPSELTWARDFDLFACPARFTRVIAGAAWVDY